jgi:hypothetical protein
MNSLFLVKAFSLQSSKVVIISDVDKKSCISEKN